MSEAHAKAPQTRHTVRFTLLTVAASVVFLAAGGTLAWWHNFLHMGQQCGYTNSCNYEMGYAGDILGWVAPVALLVIIVLTSVRVHRSNGRVWITWAIGFASLAAAHVASNLISGSALGWTRWLL
ncbi:hypothetical protein [Microbacterium nymphoidis]|uniref:hypothetical protein n=1 Tax=Microbacterium nymphoidis TaxID=2898586 RepID=UPI001E5FD312|nr:hypothetical protein [Microbacterium nymphoidis]MCD2498476.1 hypothetical protein [Microbacterium nymphoidis]